MRTIAMAAWLVGCIPAIAALPPSELTAYREATLRFLALLPEGASAQSVATAMRGKDVLSLLDILSDRQRFLPKQTFSSSDLPYLTELCSLSTKAVMSLALFDLKSHVSASTPPDKVASAMAELMIHNAIAFQDQLKHIQPFQLHCLAAEVAPMEQFVDRLRPEEFTDVRKGGLVKVRTGFTELFVGAFRVAGERGFRTDYRLSLLSTLADTTPAFVAMLPLATRRQLLTEVTSLHRSNSADAEQYVAMISKALHSQDCNTLCALP